MRRVWMAAAIPLMLACSQYRGTGHDIPGGSDPSKDRYLAETFLDTPSAGPALEAGTGCDLDGAGKVVTKDAWLRIRSRWLSGAGRMRFRGGVVREAFYLSSEPVDRVKIYFGDLVPDLGIGLVSSGRRFAYPFSSRHPLYRPAGVKGWTGFYGCFIRGTSVEISSGHVALTVVAGKPMKHGTDGVEYLGTKDVSGLRITAGSGGIRAGLTTLEGGSRKGERITGLELTAVSGGRTCMLEAAALPTGAVSVVWGLAVKGSALYCGMIGWSVPAGTEGYLASFPGLSTASDRSRSGTSLTLRRRFPRKIHLSTWGELRRSNDGGKRYLDRAARIETGMRWRRGSVRCAWSSRSRESEVIVPYPPGSLPDIDLYGGLTLNFSYRTTSIFSFVLEMKHTGSEGGEGTLGAARITLALSRLYSRIKVSAAAYRSERGRAGFSLYEPSGGGKYPWKTLYGSGSRLSFSIQTKKGGLQASAWMLLTPEGPSESAFSLSVAI